MPDFSTWKRETLEQFAKESYEAWVKLKEDNEELRIDNKALLDAWRTEVKRNGQT